MTEQVRIFTDGASRGNPGPGGWGAVVINLEASTVQEYGGREDNTTNNRMELTAIAESLKQVPEGTSVTVFTDSGYVVKGVTKWITNWRKNGWQTKQKTDVLNRDLWEELDNELARHTVSWKQVGGHVGLPGNERADEIATHYADKKDIDLYDGPKSNYTIDIDNTEVDEKALAERSAKRARSAQKAYSYVSMVNGEVQTHKTWAQTEARVKGVPRARFKKALSPDDEADIINSFKKL